MFLFLERDHIYLTLAHSLGSKSWWTVLGLGSMCQSFFVRMKAEKVKSKKLDIQMNEDSHENIQNYKNQCWIKNKKKWINFINGRMTQH